MAKLKIRILIGNLSKNKQLKCKRSYPKVERAQKIRNFLNFFPWVDTAQNVKPVQTSPRISLSCCLGSLTSWTTPNLSLWTLLVLFIDDNHTQKAFRQTTQFISGNASGNDKRHQKTPFDGVGGPRGLVVVIR